MNTMNTHNPDSGEFKWDDSSVLSFFKFLNSRGLLLTQLENEIQLFKQSHSVKEEKKEPLFVTEDGVEIFDRGVEVVGIDKETLKEVTGNGRHIGTWLNGWYTVDKIRNPKDNDPEVLREIKERFVIFSTEQAAKDYVLRNKPFMSVQDVVNRLNGYFKNEQTTLAAFDNLIHFAKQKIEGK